MVGQAGAGCATSLSSSSGIAGNWLAGRGLNVAWNAGS
jgi:hypothetical protein